MTCRLLLTEESKDGATVQRKLDRERQRLADERAQLDLFEN